MFYVGQKVVCVDDSNTRLVVNGRVYLVEGIGPCPGASAGFLLIAGIRGQIFHGMSPHRFRPLDERKTDISIFKRMLNPERIDA